MPSHSSNHSYSAETRQQITVIATGNKLAPSVFPHVFTWVNSVNHGQNVPGWREKLKRGENATTQLSGLESAARLTAGRAVANNIGGWKYEVTGAFLISQTVAAQDPSLIDDAKADAEALGKLNQRIRSVRTALEGGVVIGELGQTLRMIRNPARGLRKLTDDFLQIARAIRKGTIRRTLKQATEHLADAWLEAQFGWRPLLNDVNDGCNALNKYVIGESLQTKRVTGSSEVKGNPTRTTSVQGIGPTTWRVVELRSANSIVKYRGAVRVKARDPRTMDAALFGFDPSSFAPTVWELIPYSFLIDYFSNVGDIITGWSNLGVDVAWCNRTSLKTHRIDSWSEDLPGSNFSTFTSAKFVSTKRHVLRAKYTGTLVPSFTFQVPGSGSLKWLNIAALIASQKADRQWHYD